MFNTFQHGRRHDGRSFPLADADQGAGDPAERNGEDAYILGDVVQSEESVDHMLKTRIAVMVSGGGTNLQALIDAQKSGQIHSGEIVLVASKQPTRLTPLRGQRKAGSKPWS